MQNLPPHAAALLRDVLQATCFGSRHPSWHPSRRPDWRCGFQFGDGNDHAAHYRAPGPTGAQWNGDPAPATSFFDEVIPPSFACAEVAYVDNLAILLDAPCNDNLIELAWTGSRPGYHVWCW